MDAPREMTLTLPPDLAMIVREELTAGEYADEMEVIREALHVLTGEHTPRGHDFDATVRERYAAWLADPDSTITTDDIRAEFAAERAATR